MSRWHVRCSRQLCQTRDVFARHPDDYLRPRKCVRCGGTKFRVIRDRTKDRGDPPLCTCGGYLWVRRYARDNAPATGDNFMIRTFEIYAGMTGFPDDSADTYKAQHNSYNSVRSAALVMLSNPYAWVRVLDGDSGALVFDLMSEHHARVH